MKEQYSEDHNNYSFRSSSSKHIEKYRSADDHVVNRRESKYLAEICKINLDKSEDTSMVSSSNYKSKGKKLFSGDSFSDSDGKSPIGQRIFGDKLSGEKTNEESKEDNNEIGLLDDYLQKLMDIKVSKESPVIPDEKRLEIPEHRKSGKSISPSRLGSERPQLARFRESTNLPITSSDSSEDFLNVISNEDEYIIIEELNDLYQVFLAWIFSSKRELDTSNPIRYQSILPL